MDRRIRGWMAAVFFIAGVVVLAWGWRNDGENVRDHVARLEQAHGIRIGYGDPADFWTPPFEPEDAAAPGVEMKPASLENVAIALKGVEAALAEYPPGFVAQLIRAIFICGELRWTASRQVALPDPRGSSWPLLPISARKGSGSRASWVFITS